MIFEVVKILIVDIAKKNSFLFPLAIMDKILDQFVLKNEKLDEV